ncbi:hypothetical protein ACWNT8_05760 [Pigmentibacter ruber]
MAIENSTLFEKNINIIFGKKVNGKDIDENTSFPIASISKIFTAAIIEEIFAKNNLSLNNSCSKCF